MIVPLATISSHGYWWISLGIGLAAALVVALLLTILIRTVLDIERSVDGLLIVATEVAGNTAHIPAPGGDSARAGPHRRGGRRAGRVHERAHRRVRWQVSGTHLLALLTVVLAVVVVLVLAAALIVVRKSLERTSAGLATLASALDGVESQHLRPLEGSVKAINAQFDVILGALPGIASKAAIVAERRPQ